jgi:hypothetical protein
MAKNVKPDILINNAERAIFMIVLEDRIPARKRVVALERILDYVKEKIRELSAEERAGAGGEEAENG